MKMSLTLNDLDFAFDSIWLHTNQIPTLLHTWRELLEEYLENSTENFFEQLELTERLNYWDAMLAYKDAIIIEHQEIKTIH